MERVKLVFPEKAGNRYVKHCPCGTIFYVEPWRKDIAKYCSKTCLYKYSHDHKKEVSLIEKICLTCKSVFYTSREEAKYCSIQCVDNSHLRTSEVNAKRAKATTIQNKARAMSAETRYLKDKFFIQRNAAYVRQIEWKLTFEEWLQIWQESGHLEERGRGHGKYCMARFGDKGPYAVGNVKITTHEENLDERRNRLGEELHNAKLTTEAVKYIRANEGIISRKELAAKYDVRADHIRDIQKRRAWAWLD